MTGIDEMQAKLVPEHKVETIEEFVRRYGAVGMMGDGVNDAPAMAARMWASASRSA